MSAEVALVGFPKLQEQIATRLLAEHELHCEHIAVAEIKKLKNQYKLMMYYWPDTGDHGDHLVEVKNAIQEGGHKHLIVTSLAGKRSLKPIIGDSEDNLLLTPLQPHDLSTQLTRQLNIQPRSNRNMVDVKFLNPFVEGTVVTLKQMAEMESTRTGLQLSNDAKIVGDISGTIGLSGDAEGFVSVSFPDKLARRIVAKMMMIEDGETVTDEDMQDGVGEFMNVVAGYAKAKLANTEHSFLLSIPNVIYGGSHSVGQPRGIPVFTLDFAVQDDGFHLMVCLMPKKDQKK